MDKNKIIENLSLHCSTPVRIFVNGSVSYVPCGKCASCLLSHNSSVSQRLKDFSREHRYTYFVTLTYAPNYVPILDYQVNDMEDIYKNPNDNLSYSFYTFRPRQRDFSLLEKNRSRVYMRGSVRSEDNLLSFEEYAVPSHLQDLSKAQGLHVGSVYYAPYRDINLFLKRLRYVYKSRFSTTCPKNKGKAVTSCGESSPGFRNEVEKIHYFVVSEYGSEGTRPHWHLLLFFDTPYLAENIASFVHYAWGYGITDTQLSRGDCAQYVAGYLNCLNGSLRVLSYCKGLRPRKYASIGLRGNFLPDRAFLSDVQRVAATIYNGIPFANNGEIVLRFPDWTNICRFFPKFKGDVWKDVNHVLSLFRACTSVAYYSYKSYIWSSFDPHSDVSFVDIVKNYLYDLVKRTSAFICSHVEKSERPFSVDELFSLGVYTYVDRVLVNYLDIHFYLRKLSKLYNLSRFHVIDSWEWNIIFGRMYRFYRSVAMCFYSWHICSEDQLYTFSTILVNFWQEYNRRKLNNLYLSCEFMADERYTNIIYKDFGYEKGADSTNFTRDFFDNPFYIAAKKRALLLAQRQKAHKRLRHNISKI